MLDKIILADEVSHLIKTTYRDTPKGMLPFNLAFTDVMNKHGVTGSARGGLKSEIGRILATRPRTTRTTGISKKRPTTPSVKTQEFSVTEKTHNRVILVHLSTGCEITYVHSTEGLVVCSSHRGYPTLQVIRQGAIIAASYFVGMDQGVIEQSSITLGERSDDIATLTIAGKWKMIACRGAKGSIVAQVSDSRSGKPVKQKDLPGMLLQEARAIVSRYFMDTRTGDFFTK
ncbi:MAG: hypothetical protein A2845_02560 [Candidatus Lloydbacteria bacterium RIFCSPHIGHO2_01_FULL_49_22]|uniref:Uncharacterized protein n=1 Tax=Candidatus Lloydbacteria bacterium RIFCSPHIGHO2_01_FULL_49_22 TaxID=1798658 RepID=A0A1G2CXE0_9BACT|nr:MAG: hypothetical protein A2845_02560 [Candidatus Lloydbacteria bacterium RIFCSPHIGHO2_01_FULL_49_22]OGZ10330.1 MAG: hypothetical protein A3C14_02260 [Candidatus Lloydbacteria bacterium RIFCSPHIGHO2_02_FULL_50_18]